MLILNNTEQDVTYDVSWEGGGDCGSLGMGGTADNSNWDAHPTIEVGFSGVNQDPLSVEVGETGTNTVVTIGLYYE